MSEKETSKPIVTRKKAEKKFNIRFTFQVKGTPYGAIRKTRKERGKIIDEFWEYFTDFLILGLIAAMSPVRIFFKSHNKDFPKLRKKAVNDLLTTLQHNEVLTPTMRLCANEFYTFMSELQACAYNGAARTLRCILETAVEACEFQTEEYRPIGKTLVSELAPSLASQKKGEEGISFMIRHNAWVAFPERYRTYEKSKRIAPTFKELVNDLNSRELFNEAPKICDELKCIYEILSDYVHPNSVKFERAINGKYELNLIYNPKDFDIILELGRRTLDAVQFLYITTIARFLNYKTGREFLKDPAMRALVFSKRTTRTSLPFSGHILGGITWREKKTKLSPKPRLHQKNK